MNAMSAQPHLRPAIRPATPNDAPYLADLTTQLGYPSSDDDISSRLRGLNEQPGHVVLVYESGGIATGWIHVFIRHSLEVDPHAEIGGLVVDENCRSQGAGGALVEAAERWAREHGCAAVRVRSNLVRTRTHGFYLKLGYNVVKDQKVFQKAI
jgi:GNAT superfamily N-acetyltransferase